MSLKEINRYIVHQQDEANTASLSVARLGQITINMNKGKDSEPFKDISIFMPYPARFKAQEFASVVKDISVAACTDYLMHRHKLPIRLRSIMVEWDDALKQKAQE